jgi:hypothetical protein
LVGICKSERAVSFYELKAMTTLVEVKVRARAKKARYVFFCKEVTPALREQRGGY